MGFIIININEIIIIIYSLFFLSFISVVGGSLLMWLIFPYYNLIFIYFILKIFTLFLCGLFVVFRFFLNFILKIINNFYYKLLFFISIIWFMPIIFRIFFNVLFMKFFNYYKLFNDMGWGEFYGGLIFKNIFLFLKKIVVFLNFLNFIFILMLIFIYLII